MSDKKDEIMENKIKADKPGGFEIAGLIIIVLIFLSFLYIMADEHMKDIKADSYYKTI